MKRLHIYSAVLVLGVILTGCPSSRRLAIEGYPDAALNGKRVFVVLPLAQDIRLSNAELFATSRGIDASSAAETIEGELRTVLVSALQSRLDSNTVLPYAEQAVSGIVPLNATTDFTASGPTAWEMVKRAGKEGNIDFLLVVRDVVVTNTPASDPRGDEKVTASYALLDISGSKVMTSGTMSVNVSAPRNTATTHERLADEITSKLPFVVVD